jgi:hypothetical protein
MEHVLLPSLTFLSSGGLWWLGSGERSGGWEVNRAISGIGFGRTGGSCRRVVKVFLDGAGCGRVRGVRVIVEAWRGGCWRDSIAAGDGHGEDAAMQAAPVESDVGDGRAALPCREQRSILVGADIWLSVSIRYPPGFGIPWVGGRLAHGFAAFDGSSSVLGGVRQTRMMSVERVFKLGFQLRYYGLGISISVTPA